MKTITGIGVPSPAHPINVGTHDQTIGLYGFSSADGPMVVMGCMECGGRRELPLAGQTIEELAQSFRQFHWSCSRDAQARLDDHHGELLPVLIGDFVKAAQNRRDGGRSVTVFPEDIEKCTDLRGWWEADEDFYYGARQERARLRHRLTRLGTQPGIAMLIQAETLPAGNGRITNHRIEVTLLNRIGVQRYTVPRSLVELWTDADWPFHHVARREVANPLDRSLEGLIVEVR